jgi:TonB family protein
MVCFSRRVISVSVVVLLAAVSTLRAQQAPNVQAPAVPVPALDYPDSAGGLERLVKDILKAQKDGDTTRATALLRSLVLADARSWYLKFFGASAAANEGTKYESGSKGLPEQLNAFFTSALQDHSTEVMVERFDKTCDDNATDTTFGILQSRLEPVPLYELRLSSGNHFRRLWMLVYVDGGFRFAMQPQFPDHFLPPPEINPSSAPKATNKEPPELEKRIRTGGNVQAAKLINRVQPEYPSVARGELLQGTVRLHAIIGKDGAITRLRVLKGTCSLAQASFDAVKKWRYSPTLLFGEPVEVDTTIDVIFSLRR